MEREVVVTRRGIGDVLDLIMFDGGSILKKREELVETRDVSIEIYICRLGSNPKNAVPLVEDRCSALYSYGILNPDSRMSFRGKYWPLYSFASSTCLVRAEEVEEITKTSWQ